MPQKKRKKIEAPAPKPVVTSETNRKKLPLSKLHLLAIGLMMTLALGGYANTFHVPFQFDDQPNIVENPSVQFTGFSSFWLERLLKDTYQESLRFFAYFTFGLNYYFGKFNVFGYHLINLLIHIASGLLLYGFLLITLNLPSLKERYGSVAFPIALFSSLLFISHPIQTQSVTYIVQRMTSMAAMFYLLSMLLYVKGRLSQGRKGLLFFAGAGVSYLLGLFTKENVAILPLFIALYEFYFFQGLTVRRQEKKILTYAIGAALLIGLLMLLFWGKRYLDIINEGYQARDFTLGQRVLTQFRVVLYYVTLLIYPHPSRLNLDYDFPISRGIFDPPTTLLSMLIVLGLMGYALWRAKKRPLVSFFILWYFGNLVIESSIFPLEMVFEHRLYLPAIGPFVLFSVLVVKGWERVIESRRQKAEGSLQQAVPLWAFMLLTSMLLCVGTFQRNKVWKDEVTLWEDCVIKSPKKPRVHGNLGFFLIKGKQIEKGLEELNSALKLNPKFERAHFNLGVFYGERKIFEKAAFHLEQYLRLAPLDPKGYNEIGLLRLQEKKIEEAIRLFKKGLEINPGVEKLHANLGNAYFETNRLDNAMAEYRKALQLNPNLTEVYLKVAEVYMKKGSPDLAMEELKKALKINPSLYEVHIVRGATYVQQGRFDEAIAELTQALKYNAKDPKAYNNLGVAYRRKKSFDEAISCYKKAIALDPSFADPRINLAEIYLEKGMANDAISEFQQAINLDPNKAEVHNNFGVLLLRMKKLDEAISSFKKALTIQPEYGDACFNLAVAYYYKNDLSSASTYARKALDLGYEVDPRLLKALRIQ